MMMDQVKVATKKTRWGCLSVMILLTLLYGAARIRDMWYEKQPLSVHLRDVFKESGFEAPDYVSDIKGSKGWVDFQGDFAASVSFSVRPEDIGAFMKLPAKLWKNPKMFQPLEKDEYCGDFKVAAGAFMIEEWVSSEYHCKFAVDKRLNRIYFYRSST